MSDGEIQHPDGESSEVKDPHVEAIRSLPRLRSVEAIQGLDKSDKPFVPPPPMVSRIGGLTQGCGGVMLMVLGVLMVMVALGSGYYLWGPTLLLVGGMLLVGATRGVWSGRRTAVIVSGVVVIGVGVVGYEWQSFIPAVGALSPLGSLGMFLSPLSQLMALLLIGALAVNLASLFYWKRLKPVIRQGLILWAAAALVLVGFALALNFSEQQRRETWLKDQLNTWTAEASADKLVMGANSNITLGYSFLTMNAGDDTQLDVRLAELDAELAAGASVIRLSASGDMVWEAQTPRLFTPSGNDNPDQVAQERADRISRQQATEKTFMQHLTDSGVDLMLADSQYSPYLIVWASASNDADKLTWDDLLKVQQDRARYYAKLYQPAIYEVINDPNSYLQYTGIKAPSDNTSDMLDLWVKQTQSLIDIVHEVSPNTRIAVTVAIDNSFNLDYYERLLQMDGVDQIGFRVFQPAALNVIADIFSQRGHPADFGKDLWIVETWYGYCLAPQRSMAMDSTWLEMISAYAASERIGGVLVADYGCFLQKGGTLFQSSGADLTGRTSVWKAWQAVIAHWQPSGGS
jgi:hypothetical protein